jgi:hypothetical protein
MSPRARRDWKILCSAVVPAAVFAVDATIYIHIKGWQHGVKVDGPAAFWPVVLLLGALVFPIIAAALANAIFELASAKLSTRWLAVDGCVTDSAVKAVEHSRRAWIGWETYYSYRPAVAYEYEAAGRQYKNDLIAFGLGSLDTREEAEAMLGRFPKGARVRVHYDPDDPQSSVLQMAGGWALRAIVSALVALMLVFWLVIQVVMSR